MKDLTIDFADIQQALARAAQPPADLPHLLFHYTTAEGLLGIVETGALWASQIRYLNDSAELLYSARIIDEALDACSARYGAPVCGALQAARGNLRPAEQEQYFYVGSFSEEGDLLSQWWAYGDAGGGYAVGVRLSEVHPLPVPPVVGRVKYLEAEQRALIERMVEGAVEASGARPADEGEEGEEVFRRLMADMVLAGAFFKHESFREEREWRAVCVAGRDDPAIEFRAVGGIIVPFVPIRLHSDEQDGGAHLPIGQVVCGPTLQPTLSRRAVEALLRLRGFGQFEVRSSLVPLRPRAG